VGDETDPALRELLELLRTDYDEAEILGHNVDDDEWWITFRLKPATPYQFDDPKDEDSGVPTPEGWFQLEELVYWINRGLGATLGPREVELVPYAVPPHHNGPGSLRFEIRGHTGGDEGIEADEVADFLERIPAMVEEDHDSMHLTLEVESAFEGVELPELPE
jgi:hypothetical protein